MCIWVAQHNKEKYFQLFLFLKLLYPHGKTKFSSIEMKAIASMMQYKDERPVLNSLEELQRLNWIVKNTKTNYYTLVSFERLRSQYNWDSRASVEVTLDELNKLFAYIGAAIYTYLHKDFWRRVKKEKSVRLKGRAYHFLSPSFNYKNSHAPISILGIEALYQISKSKASILKQEAQKAGYLLVKKDFEAIPEQFDLNLLMKYCDAPKNVRRKDGKNVLQLIDLILPKINIVKRHKLGT